jgi:hypothetical protein
LQVRRVDHDAEEAVFLGRVVGGPHLQRHLVIGAEIDGLDVAARPQIPEMHVMAVFVGQQILGDDAVLELRRQAPFAGDHVVARQVPPEIVVQLLRPAVDLPAALISKVSQSMMNTPGGPSVPSGPPPPSVET